MSTLFLLLSIILNVLKGLSKILYISLRFIILIQSACTLVNEYKRDVKILGQSDFGHSNFFI